MYAILYVTNLKEKIMSNNIKYLNIDEQIDHLIDKGLLIPSKKLAKKYLSDIGYYKLINGYRTPFMTSITTNNQAHEKYCENTTIDDLYHLYQFDQSLKSLILKNISNIEVMVKSRMSDVISSKYGIKESEYLVATNFKQDNNKSKSKKFIDIQFEIIKTINNQKNKHNAIKWYSKNYGYYPFWVVSNILTLGTISQLYSIMKQPDQYEISKTFGVKSKLFESILMIMQLFRNACAHNEIVYNLRTFCSLSQKDIVQIYNSYNIKINPKNGKYQKGTNDLFALIIIFKLLLSKGQFTEFISQLKSLINNLKKKIDNTKFSYILDTMGIVGDLEIIKNLHLK